jgi:ribulose-phosphate 3-epimerase
VFGGGKTINLVGLIVVAGGEVVVEVLPAIIAGDQLQLDERLGLVAGFADHVMLDVMDGVFVPGRSLDFDFTLPKGPMHQAHLMVTDPLRRMSRLAEEADTAVIHVEAVEDVPDAIAAARDYGLEAYLAVNPDTPVGAVLPHLPRLDGVLVMTVQPGGYGSPFLPWCLGKVGALRSMDEELFIEVDGGMNPETATMAVEMGADAVAAGSYIFASGDPMKAYTRLVEAVHAAKLRFRGT